MDIAADGEEPQPGIDLFCKIAFLVNAPDVAVALCIRQTVALVDQAHDLMERIPQRFDQDMVMVRHETPRQNREGIL